eukprot:2812421-Amphidinium_carterae.1
MSVWAQKGTNDRAVRPCSKELKEVRERLHVETAKWMSHVGPLRQPACQLPKHAWQTKSWRPTQQSQRGWTVASQERAKAQWHNQQTCTAW